MDHVAQVHTHALCLSLSPTHATASVAVCCSVLQYVATKLNSLIEIYSMEVHVHMSRSMIVFSVDTSADLNHFALD